MRFGLLGPLEVLGPDGPVDVTGRQPRIVLAVLLLAQSRPVPVDTLVDGLWGEDPPASAVGTLQSYVSRLRRLFEDSPASLVRTGGAYALERPPGSLDTERFDQLADEGARLLAAGDAGQAAEVLTAAESLWRGPALAELADIERLRGTAVRLEERRLAALEHRAEALALLGRHADVVADLSPRVLEFPLRERLHGQLALALYRSGRQAEALRVLADAGATLRDQLGLEPGRELRDLERAILDQDPRLDATAPTPRAGNAEPAPPPASGSPGTPTLVGRDHELDELTTLFGGVAEGAAFAVLEGEPGIGKTRLAEELATRAEAGGMRVVWGRADEGGAAPALWPWLDPLRRLAAELDEVPPSVAELIAGRAHDADPEVSSAQFERFDTITRMITSVTTRQPVLVVLDDLQWFDTASLDLLGFVAAGSGPGLAVVATMRPAETTGGAPSRALSVLARQSRSRRLVLRGLDADDTATVVRRAAGALDRSAASTIHARSDGNPFFALELARLAGEGQAPDEAVPGTVRDVIRQRLRRLPDDDLEVLAIAAVVGRDVDLGVLATVAGQSLDTTLDRLELAMEMQLLAFAPDRVSTLRFSHALVRDVLVEGIPPLRRARLHLQVADALEARGIGPDETEIVAEHLWRAAPLGVGLRAADALERAAEVAVGRVSYTTAEVLLTRAVELRQATATTAEERLAELGTIERLLDVARAIRYYQGADPKLIRRGQQLAEQLGEDRRRITLMWFAWGALAVEARVSETEAPARELHEATAGYTDPGIRSVSEQILGVWNWCNGRIDVAVEHLDRAVALLAEGPLPVDQFSAEHYVLTHCFWALNHGLHGDPPLEEVTAAFDAFNELAPNGAAVAAISCFAATLATALGDWELVERYRRTATEADPTAQYAFWGGQLAMYEAMLLARAGEIADARRRFGEGKDRYLELGARTGLVTFESRFAALLAEAGDHEAAATHLVTAREEFEQRNERWNEPVLLIAEAIAARERGDAATERERLAVAVQVAQERGAGALATCARSLSRA